MSRVVVGAPCGAAQKCPAAALTHGEVPHSSGRWRGRSCPAALLGFPGLQESVLGAVS